MEFNTKTRTGTFYNARGSTILGDQGESTDRSMFGGKEPDAYFWGEALTKVGPKKYKIENGGFTTCVQPTPRWEVVSGSLTINLDDYAFLTNSVFRVKGVPLMYLPVFYYPIQEDDRATGFLIPTYGAATVKGQMHQQLLLLGDRPQPRRDDVPRLDVQGRPAGRRRIPLHPRSRLAGRQPVYCSTKELVTSQTARQTTGGTRSYSISGKHDAAAARNVLACGPMPTTSPASSRSRRISRTSPARPTAAAASAPT